MSAQFGIVIIYWVVRVKKLNWLKGVLFWRILHIYGMDHSIFFVIMVNIRVNFMV